MLEAGIRAARVGVSVIAVNPESTELDSIAAVRIYGKAVELLPAIVG